MSVSVDPGVLRATDARRSSWSLPGAALGLAVLGLVALVLAFPGMFVTHAPEATDLTATFQSPSAEHIFGTDQLGRDVYSRLVYGTRISMTVAAGATVLGVGLGGLIGLVAALAAARVDAMLMRLVDVMLAFPELLLALLVVAVIGDGSVNVAVAIGVAAVPNYARLVRGQTQVIIRSEYVEAARVLGVPRPRYVLRHVVPNIGGPLIVLASIGSGSAIVAGAGLSLLGLGPRPPAADWGSMVADGKAFLQSAWWISVTPGLLIMSVVVALTLVGRYLQASELR
jgi:peptide/nickel transport system permease protein